MRKLDNRKTNARERRIALLFVFKRDGCRCNNHDGRLFHNPRCKKSGDESRLILDHVDNNAENNDPYNWQALCRSCNTMKNPRGKGKRGQRVKKRLADCHKMHSTEREKVEDGPKPSSQEYEQSKKCKGKFRSWIVNKVFDEGRVSRDEAINSGAEHSGCEQQAIIRYLEKLCSDEGILKVEVVDGHKYIILKPEFTKLSAEEILNQQAKNWKDGVVQEVRKLNQEKGTIE